MKKAFLFVAAVALSAAAFAQPKLNKDNIDEVLKAMTLEEKATLAVGGNASGGPAGTPAGTALVPGAAGRTAAIPRLGIPATVLADGPAGLRIEPTRKGSDDTFFCTAFPIGTMMASSWNTPLVEQLTSAMGQEVKEYGVDVLLAPGQNLHRNPLCGRNFEYFSEDPLLTGKMSAAYVRGVQSNGVGVSIKHFATNNQEINRTEGVSRVNPRPLRELYLKGFEISVKESSPWTVMSSYNQLNGEFTQQSYGLLTTILREEWGYGGIVMTDWGNKAGTVKAVHAGNDLMEPGARSEIDRIIAAVGDGTLSEADLDRNVRRILEYIVKTPSFAGYKFSNKPDLKAHASLVRDAAPEGMVLLENDGVLPFDGISRVALYGVGSYDFISGGTGSGYVNREYSRNVAEGLVDNGITPDPDIARLYTQYIDYRKSELSSIGRGWHITVGQYSIPELEIPRKAIESKVSANDIAVMTICRNAGEGDDRNAEDGDWTLTASERGLMQDLADVYHAAGKKLVVVLNIGGVIETSSWKHIPDAILLAWAPGQEGGFAVADILSGKSYPSGKLPMTFPESYFDIPSSFNFPHSFHWETFDRNRKNPVKDFDYTDYAEGIWVGYRYFVTAGKKVSYPFGYGLSYTAFAYSKPSVKVSKDGTLTASVTVTNSGQAPGKEIVQLYISAPSGGLAKPARELKGFAKTRELKPGESETLTVTVDPYTLASFNEGTSAWETAAGTYTAHFGASVADIRGSVPFKISKAQSWPVAPACVLDSPVEEISL